MTVFALSLLLATLSYGVWCRWHFGLVDERQAAERYDLELDRTRFKRWARDLTARERALAPRPVHLYDQASEPAVVLEQMFNTYRCHAALQRIDEAAE